MTRPDGPIPPGRARRLAPAHAGPPPLPRQAGELKTGDQVVYRHRGQVVSEMVDTAEPLSSPTGYVAVRFLGRDLDVHYPVHTCLQVAR